MACRHYRKNLSLKMQTRGEQMLALRRARLAASPPFLRGGFRPFFFGGAAWAVLALLLWLAALSGAIALPSALDALAWHRHEMLFGFVGAVICGFLLTAIPNWTGRLPIAGTPLAALFDSGLPRASRSCSRAFQALRSHLCSTSDFTFFSRACSLAKWHRPGTAISRSSDWCSCSVSPTRSTMQARPEF